MWFYSRTFLTEPYTWAWTLLALWALTSDRLALASLFLALTLAMKETALLLVLPILVGCAALTGRRKAMIVAIGPALFAVVFVMKNILLVGAPLSTFQPFRFGNPYHGAVGLLFDPAHGLVWFAPLVVVAAGGWLVRSENTVEWWLGVLSLAVFSSYFAVTAAWADWTGGGAYGPRLLVPALPSLAIPLARIRRTRPIPMIVAGLGILCVVGFTVGWCAALDPRTAFWGASAARLMTNGGPVAIAGAAMGAAFLYSLDRRDPP